MAGNAGLSRNTGRTLIPAWVARIDTACANLAALGLLAMVCGFFLLRDYGDIARIFYLLILLPVLLSLPWRLAGIRAEHWPYWAALIAAPLLLALSALWTQPGQMAEGRSVFYFQKPLFFLLALLLGCQAAMARWPQLPTVLVRAIVLAALPSAMISLALYLPDAISSGNWERMAGFSMRGDINVTATLFGVTALLCAYGLLHWAHSWRPLLLASLLASILVSLLSQSKVPLLCCAVAMGWLALVAWRYQSLALRIWLLLLPLTLLVAYFLYFGRIPLLHRAEGYTIRLELWSQALDQFLQYPWLGHGLGTRLELCCFNGEITNMHAHNLVLDTLRFAGIGAAALLIGQILFIALCGIRQLRADRSMAPVLIWWLTGVFFLLTNGQQPLVKPHHIWFFYWIPSCLILARDMQVGARTTQAG
jgi:O-antigen ligase